MSGPIRHSAKQACNCGTTNGASSRTRTELKGNRMPKTNGRLAIACDLDAGFQDAFLLNLMEGASPLAKQELADRVILGLLKDSGKLRGEMLKAAAKVVIKSTDFKEKAIEAVKEIPRDDKALVAEVKTLQKEAIEKSFCHESVRSSLSSAVAFKIKDLIENTKKGIQIPDLANTVANEVKKRAMDQVRENMNAHMNNTNGSLYSYACQSVRNAIDQETKDIVKGYRHVLVEAVERRTGNNET